MASNWDLRFLQMARLIGSWSKDPSTRVGAVIVDASNRIISTGFNGFPRGISDDARLKSKREKYTRIIHAEENAMLFANETLEGATIYVTPLYPCSNCAAKIVQAGIRRVVCTASDDDYWNESMEIGIGLFDEAGIIFEVV